MDCTCENCRNKYLDIYGEFDTCVCCLISGETLAAPGLEGALIFKSCLNHRSDNLVSKFARVIAPPDFDLPF